MPRELCVIRKIAEALASTRANVAAPARPPRNRVHDAERDANVAALEAQLSDAIGVPVTINMANFDSGAVTLRFASLDQLDLISARIAGETVL